MVDDKNSQKKSPAVKSELVLTKAEKKELKRFASILDISISSIEAIYKEDPESLRIEVERIESEKLATMSLQHAASAAMSAATKLPKLKDKKDYVPWAMNAESILTTNGLWIDADGIENASAADTLKSTSAYHVLVVMLSPEVQLMIRSLKTVDSVVVWNFLEEKFVGSGVVPVINLIDEVFSMKHIHGTQPVSVGIFAL